MQTTPSSFFNPARDTQMLMAVALGDAPADLAVVNAKLVNVYTGEVRPHQAVCVKDAWIAYVGDNPQPSLGSATRVIDAGGRTLIPGLIDGHTHLAWLIRIDEFIRYAAVGGTTSMVTETMEAYPVAGLQGLEALIDAMADQAVKVFCTAPFMASISRRSRGVAAEDLRRILSRPEVIGLGESYWQSLLQQPARLIPALEKTLKAGKCLEGHSAGASERKLNAYLAAGITSCHEPIRAEEVLQRLRLGLYVMVREGSIRRDLEEIAGINAAGVDLRRLVLVTDGLSPKDLMEKGCMAYVVQKAIDSGFDPVAAIQMATLNAAEHFGLDHLIGGVAPGRLADMLIIPDIHHIEARTVISNGQVIARSGSLLKKARRHVYPRHVFQTIRLPRPASQSDFKIEIDSDRADAKVRAIQMVTDLVTREVHLDLPLENGELKADPDRDLLKIAAIDRARGDGRRFVGLIQGFNMHRGAIACSTGWDSADIVVVGAVESDMAAAVNRIHELGGAAIISDQGNIIGQVDLPVLGIASDHSLQTTLEQVLAFNRTAADLGIQFADPLLTLSTLTGAAIPYLRICEEGLVNLKDGKTVGLVVAD